MILQSTINNNSYAWVRIPKTATRSYTKLLDTTNNDRHTKYSKIVETLDHKIPGVTVVRNPHTRLISALKHFCGVLHAQLQNPKNNNHIIRYKLEHGRLNDKTVDDNTRSLNMLLG